MRKSEKQALVKRALGEPAFQKGDELIYFCPRKKCQHHKPKLSINVNTDEFHCWVCNFKGPNLLPVLKFGGNQHDIDRYYASIDSVAALKDKRKDKNYVKPVLPKEFRSLSKPCKSPDCTSARRYLNNRGIMDDEIVKYKLGYCESGKYSGRIIIPSFDDDGDLNFFVGRAFYERVGISYKHEEFNKDIIWNEYTIDWKKPVIVTEGPFDAMKAGFNSIPLQGSILRRGSRLFNSLVTKCRDGVYFAMDSDAYKKQLSIIDSLFHYGVDVRYVDLMGHKDVGEMTHEQFDTAKLNARKISSGLDLLRMRICSA
jgi:hypothetical protein